MNIYGKGPKEISEDNVCWGGVLGRNHVRDLNNWNAEVTDIPAKMTRINYYYSTWDRRDVGPFLGKLCKWLEVRDSDKDTYK